MQQNWLPGADAIISDQYGFTIKIRSTYFLFHKGVFIVNTYSLEAAKEISLILINDKIMNK